VKVYLLFERVCACGYEDGTSDVMHGVYASASRAFLAATEHQDRMRAGKWTVPEALADIGGPQGLSPYEEDNWRGLWVDEQEVVE
jgi:hypothetical protein